MIFKCKNCGQEFNVDPQYCDCGNNVFIQIQEAKDKIISDDSNPDVPTPPKMDFEIPKTLPPREFTTVIVDDTNSVDDDLSEKNDVLKENYWNTVGLIVLIISLFFGLTLIYRAFSAPSSQNQPKASKPIIASVNIPDIDSFWDNSNNKTNQTNSSAVNTNSVNEDYSSKSKDVQQTVVSEQKSKNAEISISKILQENKPKKSKTSQKTSNEIIKPKQTVKSDKDSAPIKQKQVVKPQSNQTPKANNTNSVIEYVKYKNSLRQALFNKFPIMNVSGQGTAQVGFSVSSDGKLLNRRFIKESDNKSLNDAMYHMLMQNPSFTPPPAGYSGAEIILQMEYNDGYYSFSYIK